jgi:hypothetical protein
LQKPETTRSLKKLCTQQLIVSDAQSGLTLQKYRFRIDLLRLWVMRQTL